MSPSMKKAVRVGSAALIGLGLIFLAGPRVAIDQTIRPVDLPDDLEGYLQETEGAVSGIRFGTEKTIIWADPVAKMRTPLAVVYLHGFSATRQETAPLADDLARELGANLFYTRLTGHGLDGPALAEATVNDWLNDAVEALAIGRRLGDRVIVIGASTGGTLATWLTTHPESEGILAVILLSPNFGLRQRTSELMLWPWAHSLVPLLVGPSQERQPFSRADGEYWTTTYPTTALLPVMGLVKLSRRLDYAQIQTPVFIAFSRSDTRVDPTATEARYQQLGTPIKQLVVVDDAGDPFQHVIAGDIRSPGTTERLVQQIFDFLQPLITA